jgi:nitrite reductase/ring-hydroxylating ferredoxin subunit
MEGYTDVLPVDALTPGALRKVEVRGDLVLLANVDGEIHAIGAICTHEQEDLADGEIKDGCVVCPMHFARFSLETGVVMDGPARKPEPVYDVRIDGGRIFVGPRRR